MKKIFITLIAVMVLSLTSCDSISKTAALKDSSHNSNETTGIYETISSGRTPGSSETAVSKINLNNLIFDLPKNMTKKVTESDIVFYDVNEKETGGISLVGYYGTYTGTLPNHSETINTKDIHTNLGTGKLFTLKCGNPAASGSTETWDEVHAIIPVNGNNVAYDIWLKGTKDNLTEILNSIR